MLAADGTWTLHDSCVSSLVADQCRSTWGRVILPSAAAQTVAPPPFAAIGWRMSACSTRLRFYYCPTLRTDHDATGCSEH